MLELTKTYCQTSKTSNLTALSSLSHFHRSFIYFKKNIRPKLIFVRLEVMK